MDKRGISPLIATVLIICMTVLIGVIIMAWSGVFTKGLLSSADAERDKLMVCNSEVSLNIRNACIDGANINLMIENAGTKAVRGIIARVIGNSGGYQEDKEVLISEGGLGSAVVAYTPEAIGNFKQIEILPRVDIKGKDVICGIADTHAELIEC